MARVAGPGPSAPAFLWPALAAVSASDAASAMVKEFAKLALGSAAQPRAELPWATSNRIVLELKSGRLRDFSVAAEGPAALVCAPFALHAANLADLARDHSLVAALIGSGQRRLFVIDWRSADAEMRFFSIDTYLADLNVVIDELGGRVDLIGLCQGGWLALIYAARFPAKVRKLVLAGAPIDIAAAESSLVRAAQRTPLAIFDELVELGEGRMLGRHILQFWGPIALDTQSIQRVLQSPRPVKSAAFRRLEARFREWYEWTLDLPGTYYLEAVERLFKENQLARGRFVALGRRIELAHIDRPLFLLAAQDDEIVAPAQILAAADLVATPAHDVRRIIAPCTHLGLFLGRAALTNVWPRIARWLSLPQNGGMHAHSGSLARDSYHQAPTSRPG